MKKYVGKIPYDAISQAAKDKLMAAVSYLKPEDVALIEHACDYANDAHVGQTRQSGEAYITHPIAVATELAYWHMDAISIASGLMHDVLEDTGTTKLQLAAEFDDTIADIVDGLSKLEKLEYSSKEEHQAESFRKMILAMIKDIRVIIIKLSDRLHNMRTLGAVRPDKRRRIANETLEIYAQLANRIGLNEVYRELQDLAFKSLHPNRYKVLTRALEASRRNRRDVVGKVLTTFSQCLVAFNIEAQIKGREKNLFSIHSKMMQKNLRFAEVMDIYGFRVIVNNVPTCYTALGALHSIYKPKPGKIKDYIAIPKNNGYQSIHTTLVGPYGLPIEVQIRTREMDEIAEGGVASHWMYKSNGASFDAASVRTHQWMQNILDLQAESDNAIEFLEHVKVDLFPDEVYLFTPKGKIIVLPRGATPVDFAYAVHTDIGNHCVAARVNNNMVPLRTVLNTGDTIEVITSTKSNPNPAWLNFVVSGRARSGIRAWIKTMNRHDAVILGESLLNKALVSLLPKQLLLSEELRDQYLNQLAHKNTNFEDVLYEVGMGRLLPVVVAKDLAKLAGETSYEISNINPVKIYGTQNGNINLAQCCRPIPGDAIRAQLAENQGILVHRDQCATILAIDADHQLPANWDLIDTEQLYPVHLLINARDKQGLLAALASAMSGAGANILSVETPSTTVDGIEGFIEFRFKLEVKNLQHLQKVSKAIEQIPQVRKVNRV